MFLLNRKTIEHITCVFSNLHPIMFLLNRYHLCQNIQSLWHLHPIMFLLNRLLNMVDMTARSNLHPIMFLLNHSPKLGFSSSYFKFTSHYVPIKSMYPFEQLYLCLQFTSHYVPIKSIACAIVCNPVYRIYIPLCSY